MADVKTKYEPRFIFGVPTVFITVMYLSMWLLWPSDVQKQPANAHTSGMKVHYARFGVGFGVLDPVWAILESDADLALRDDDQVDSDLIMADLERPARYLKSDLNKTSGGKGVDLLLDTEVRATGAYSLKWNTSPLFSSGNSLKNKLFIEPHCDFAKKGFTIPKSDTTLLDNFKAPWQITAYIDVNAEGVPEHVFLIRSSGDPKVDAVVVRELYKSRLTSTGERSGGRVTVNWGES